jgi:microcystin-dependent protein
MEAYLGQIRIFAGNYAPEGWAICNGSSLSTANYMALYSLIGNTYGGDQNNFLLPDLRGRLPLHIGKAPGQSTQYALGDKAGVEAVILNTNNLPAHTHTLNATSADAARVDPSNALPGATVNNYYLPVSTPGFDAVGMNVNMLATDAGGFNAHENHMPTMALNYIICIVGLYPDFQ